MEAIPPDYDDDTKERIYRQEWLEYFFFIGRDVAMRDYPQEYAALFPRVLPERHQLLAAGFLFGDWLPYELAGAGEDFGRKENDAEALERGQEEGSGRGFKRGGNSFSSGTGSGSEVLYGNSLTGGMSGKAEVQSFVVTDREEAMKRFVDDDEDDKKKKKKRRTKKDGEEESGDDKRSRHSSDSSENSMSSSSDMWSDWASSESRSSSLSTVSSTSSGRRRSLDPKNAESPLASSGDVRGGTEKEDRYKRRRRNENDGGASGDASRRKGSSRSPHKAHRHHYHRSRRDSPSRSKADRGRHTTQDNEKDGGEKEEGQHHRQYRDEDRYRHHRSHRRHRHRDDAHHSPSEEEGNKNEEDQGGDMKEDRSRRRHNGSRERRHRHGEEKAEEGEENKNSASYQRRKEKQKEEFRHDGTKNEEEGGRGRYWDESDRQRRHDERRRSRSKSGERVPYTRSRRWEDRNGKRGTEYVFPAPSEERKKGNSTSSPSARGGYGGMKQGLSSHAHSRDDYEDRKAALVLSSPFSPSSTTVSKKNFGSSSPMGNDDKRFSRRTGGRSRTNGDGSPTSVSASAYHRHYALREGKEEGGGGGDTSNGGG